MERFNGLSAFDSSNKPKEDVDRVEAPLYGHFANIDLSLSMAIPFICCEGLCFLCINRPVG